MVTWWRARKIATKVSYITSNWLDIRTDYGQKIEASKSKAKRKPGHEEETFGPVAETWAKTPVVPKYPLCTVLCMYIWAYL